MATKGFRVDPDKLLDVADQVHELMRSMSGDAGYVSGNLPHYQEKAGAQILTEALSSFWSGDDVFANAYDEEHKGVCTTMQNMVTQLQNLETACRSTANQYKSQDGNSKQSVTKSGGWT